MASWVIRLAIKTTESGRHQVTIAQFYFWQEKCDTGPLFMDMAVRCEFYFWQEKCANQCRDEERCAENHSNDHNSALETIQMPSFWEHTRLGVLHHDKASRDTEARHGRRTERPPRRPAARAACREAKLAAVFFFRLYTPS